MDPYRKLYKQLDNLSVSPSTNMSAKTDNEVQQVTADSGITPEVLKAKLAEGLGATYVEIKDMSGTFGYFCYWLVLPRTTEMLTSRLGGCGQMFEAVIVSPQFAKKTTLARHRLVNGVLKQEIAAIHAWTPKCHTPEEWEKKQQA